MTDGRVSSEMKVFEIGRSDTHVVPSPVLQKKMQGSLRTVMWSHLCFWGATSKEQPLML